MIRAAIFDVDGTLLDSMQMWINYGSDFLRLKGIEPPADIDEVIQYFSLRETAEYFSENFGLGTADELEAEARRLTREFYFDKVQPKEGVQALLQMLYDEGIPMYVATATYRELIAPALERTGLMKYFKGIVTCTEVGYGKDRPDVFLAALTAMNAPLEGAWIFEDAMHAVKTAKAAGFSVCGVYDQTEDHNKEELEKLCDIYTDRLDRITLADFKQITIERK